MVNELKYPLTKKQVICYDDKDVRIFVEVQPNQVCSSGQPFMGVYATKLTLGTKVKTLTMTAKNVEDYQRFISPEIKEVIIEAVK